ncbi:PepSY domain-containing protein [Aliigemmobacter aestuarii]|uniref:PepSY domain-containing protein n=1 Tax=Aliigemmobacter aestuarii TaxID=1445661 RepID=UPI001B3B28D9|nr:PepSY domain-containing protein [Gemmobacter aestuarii]
MKLFTTFTAGLVFAGSMAFAEISPQTLAADYQAQGYTRVEIKTGPNQIKVEAIRGMQKTEVIYDRRTGAILKSEVEGVDSDDNTRPGVQIRERARDFVRGIDSSRPGRGWDDDDDDDDGKGRGRGRGGRDDDDRDDDDRGRDRGSDDDDDDDRGRGRGSDDDHDDDRGRGRGSDD